MPWAGPEMISPNMMPPWAGPELLPPNMPWAGPEMISPNMMPPWVGPELLPPDVMPPEYLFEESPYSPPRWRRPPARTRRKKKRHHREWCDSTSSSFSSRDSRHDGPYDLPYQDCRFDSGTQENATPLTYPASHSMPALPAQEVWPNWEQGHDESSSS
jgi:hypothetical protein